jgi:hypothetical protein
MKTIWTPDTTTGHLFLVMLVKDAGDANGNAVCLDVKCTLELSQIRQAVRFIHDIQMDQLRDYDSMLVCQYV